MFAKIKELLEAGKIDQETAEALDAEVSAELKKLRDEAAQWRTKYKETHAQLEELSQSKGEIEKQLENLDERIAKAKEEGKSELAAQLEKEREEKEALAKRLGELEAAAKNLRIENELSRALSRFDYEPVDAEVVSEYLKSRHVSVDGDKVLFKEGEATLPLEEGLKRLVQERPGLFKAKGNPGSGAGGGGTTEVSKKWRDMTATERLELYKKDPALYERLKKEQGE